MDDFSLEQREAWKVLEIGPIYRDKFAEAVVLPAADPIQVSDVRVVAKEAISTNSMHLAPVPSAIAGSWLELKQQVSECSQCALSHSRTQTVFSGGAQHAPLMIIGEAPGEEEDRSGEPFVGQAGKLLASMLKAIGLERERDVLLLNSLKCRPPANRNPSPEEMAACKPFLHQQIELAQPRLILLTGKFAALAILGKNEPLLSMRGQTFEFTTQTGLEIPVMVTYHPAYYLRRLTEKSKAWTDLLAVKHYLAKTKNLTQSV